MADGNGITWRPNMTRTNYCRVYEFQAGKSQSLGMGDPKYDTYDSLAKGVIRDLWPEAESTLSTEDYNKLVAAVREEIIAANKDRKPALDDSNDAWYLDACISNKSIPTGTPPSLIFPATEIGMMIAAYKGEMKQACSEEVKKATEEAKAKNEALAAQAALNEIDIDYLYMELLDSRLETEVCQQDLETVKQQVEDVKMSCSGKVEETQEGAMYIVMDLNPVLKDKEIDHYETKPVQVQIMGLPTNTVEIKVLIDGKEQTIIEEGSDFTKGTIFVSFAMSSIKNLSVNHQIQLVATLKTSETTTETVTIISKHYGVLVKAAEPKVVVVKEAPKNNTVKIDKKPVEKKPKKGVCDGRVKEKYLNDCNAQCKSKVGTALNKCIGKYK